MTSSCSAIEWKAAGVYADVAHATTMARVAWLLQERLRGAGVLVGAGCPLAVPGGEPIVVDLALFQQHSNDDALIRLPPAAVIEVLTSEDRAQALFAKLKRLRMWGVPHLFLIDPSKQLIVTGGDPMLKPLPSIEVPGFGLSLLHSEVFGEPCQHVEERGPVSQ
ncbi:MAG: Uma2 family endonuclease [Acidobacteria bacterium]|nr:Uma2 family endonuclease [Acidobacteriota bacterium]